MEVTNTKESRMLAKPWWSVRTGARTAVCFGGESVPHWEDGTPLTEDEMLEVGFKQHPSVGEYVEAVRRLQSLWDSIPQHKRIAAEYGASRISIPHEDWAKENTVWT
jgi:hypothetical protein